MRRRYKTDNSDSVGQIVLPQLKSHRTDKYWFQNEDAFVYHLYVWSGVAEVISGWARCVIQKLQEKRQSLDLKREVFMIFVNLSRYLTSPKCLQVNCVSIV